MIRGTYAVFAVLLLGLSAHADGPACDPQLDSCKSSREGYLMMCACLEKRADLNFRGLDLRRAVFQSSGTPANLSGADLSGANLSGSSVLRGCRLTAADLRGANLEGTDFLGVTGFRTAKVSGATFNEKTALPIESVRPDEWGTPSQFRRVGCDLGMQWRGNDPVTGVAENCEGSLSSVKFAEVQQPGKMYEGSVIDQKNLDAALGVQSPVRSISSSGTGAR